LSGPIPDLGNLTKWLVLYLSYNQLRGEVPDTIVALESLRLCDLGHNMLSTSDPGVLAFLHDKDPDWAQAETVAPTDVHVVDASETSVQLGWTPIAYTRDGGYYEVSYTGTSGGLYIDTVSKTEDGYLAEGVSPCAGNSFSMAVRTCTPAHGYPGFLVYQQNDLWSDYGELSIAPLPSPNLSFPADGSSAFVLSTFAWNRVGGATCYRIQVAIDPDFSVLPISDTVCTTSYTPSGLLSEGDTYYWRVGAFNLCDDGPWSEEREFTVMPFSFWLFLPLIAWN
jgi:hypothetical protein